MFEQIITLFCAESFFASAITNIDVLAGVVDKYLVGMSNVRIVSYLLMFLAFIVFLFLVIVIYVKSIIAFLRFDSSAPQRKNKMKNEIHDAEDADDDEDFEKLQHELELEELRKKQIMDQQKELERQEKRRQDILMQKKEQARLEEEQKAQKDKEEKESAQKQNNQFGIDLDWKKGKTNDDDASSIDILSGEVLHYQQSNKTLPELIGLIIDMIARKVDDLKIAQTIMYRNQGKSSEDEVLQTIAEVKNFLALAAHGKFNEIRKKTNLPDDATAILHLSEGDATYALALLENLMDAKIETASSMTNGARKDQIFQETSNMACTFGTLSALTDTRLATGSFELAIELHPQNVNAWNRAADLYNKAGSYNQALKTYQHVLDIADEEINAEQVANANKMLSQFYYEQGNNLQAAKLYNASKLYYDSLGINRRLDRQELEIIDLIEQKQKQDIQQTIATILANQDLQYSYAL